ncbi:hypothetical protein [Streptomyces rishiriensis]|uniref:Uncharacterized protein n=1 Tax=Streptomyces rishiriensis TaxID=68264 RepID=A0ABU0NQT9_STRRH|nr:hypothetical protein [Streptomyces rishiriensis]MDQ0580917.1 hypothetical protein [Streptomyces rishiriensis]
MNGSGKQADRGDSGFEERMRELLAEDAYTIQPSSVPYPAIRRRGLAERRRRVALTGAALMTLAAVPVGAYAVAGGSGGRGADTAAPKPSVSAPHSTAGSASTTPGGTAAGPGKPATDGQLLDGITFTQAADGLRKCLAAEGGPPGSAADLGGAEDYRIIQAIRSTGDSHDAGDGIYVTAVNKRSAGRWVICSVKDGVASGISTGSIDAGAPGAGPVTVDGNGEQLYQQSFIDKGTWKLPFRWGVVGAVEASVAEVTVSYGDDGPVTAALDHGWFAAAGVLNQQVSLAPHIKGYDDSGKLVYDSDQDGTYRRTLP